MPYLTIIPKTTFPRGYYHLKLGVSLAVPSMERITIAGGSVGKRPMNQVNIYVITHLITSR